LREGGPDPYVKQGKSGQNDKKTEKKKSKSPSVNGKVTDEVSNKKITLQIPSATRFQHIFRGRGEGKECLGFPSRT